MAKCEIEMKVDIRDVEKNIKQLEEQVEDWKSDHEHNLERMKGLNNRISELEKENAELKSELTKKADTNHSLVEQMAKLEEINAELKKKLEYWKSEYEKLFNEQ